MIRGGLKRKILFSLSFLADVYIELSPRSFYRKMYSPLYQETSITETLSRMARVGEIEKKIVDGEPLFQITTQGESHLNEAIPLKTLANKPWDRIWRIVIFDINEKESHIRNMIRQKLKTLGFAMWQKSVYISPHSFSEEINEFFENKKLFPACVCFEAKEPKVYAAIDFADHVFHTPELTATYAKLRQDIQNYIVSLEKNETVQNKYESFRIFFDRFESLLYLDPFLPKELIKNPNEREMTQKSLSNLQQIIAKT